MVSLTELRSCRIFGSAVFDFVASVVGVVIVLLIAKYFRDNLKDLPIVNFVFISFVLALPLGIFVHILFGVNTALNYKLGLSQKPL